MTTTPTTGLTPAVATTPFQTSNPTQGTASKDPLGRDAFLNLLVTQLQHQDPTQPQADGEFLTQLATFSQLEQLQAMNQKIAELTDLIKNGTP
ncbi:MAG TPA: flagellar hook capping FlgD N-terminal domain-containing protein [Vicinamibacterales bacterium]|nr:flagellar hook capping FlgD N-terminal domain-containing protein [Vicinamibacterales bacterium]